ncbi:MAG: flagellar biosynthetic protein FliO [Acidobacteriia bacterium]|nr:flagellar biosynthetic protein FliO [Terriglobia bacterium]
MGIATTIPRASTALARISALLSARLNTIWRSQKKRKTLSVRETASLGERRFVAVIQFERHRFLIGASPSSVNLLTQLPDDEAPSIDFRSGGAR